MKSKGTATLLCMFLGGIGGHHFYLGKSKMGILYALFCWTFIPSIIATIDLFRLLFMKDVDFDQQYNSAS